MDQEVASLARAMTPVPTLFYWINGHKDCS